MIKLKQAAAAMTVFAVLALNPASAQNAGSGAHWIATWTAPPQGLWAPSFPLSTGVPATLRDQTVRERLRISAGGQGVRLVFSNRYGSAALLIGATSVAVAEDPDATARKAVTRVTFGGRTSVSVAPGKEVVSDAVGLMLPALSTLVVSSYYPQASAVTTFHWGGQQHAEVGDGDRTGEPAVASSASFPGRAFLSAVQVDAAPGARVVAAFGDSITDGNGSSPGRNRRWPDFLAERLASRNLAVINAGISGARVLGDLMGDNALSRFERDVLAQPGISAVVVLMGINDIGWPGSPFAPRDPQLDPERLFAAYRQLVERAHARNVRVIGVTLPPFEGALRATPFEGHYSAGKELLRQRVNDWIRHAGVFDAVVDADALLRDPRHPTRMHARYDSGDHLHPGDAGYQTMAKAIDVDLVLGEAALAPSAR